MTNLVIFRARLRALLSVFNLKFFCLEQSCEWADAKIWNFLFECCYIPFLVYLTNYQYDKLSNNP